MCRSSEKAGEQLTKEKGTIMIRGNNGKTELKKFRALLFVAASLLIFSCSTAVKPYLRPGTDVPDIKKVAVLPFENLTRDEHAGEKIRNAAIMDLLSRGINVTEPGEVLKILKELQIGPYVLLPAEDIKSAGESLEVDAFITGSVETFGTSKGINVSYPEVSIHLMLVEPEGGSIIWSVWHTTGGASFWTRHFGAEGRTIDETSRIVVREAFDTLF
jgi:TolB-like protein